MLVHRSTTQRHGPSTVVSRAPWVPWALGLGALTLLALRKRSGTARLPQPGDTRPSADPAAYPFWRADAEYLARGTGYYPDPSPMEGGYHDRRGQPLGTLQAFLAGETPYVSVAMDTTAFPYGARLRIPELEQRYGREIVFRVTDTGGAFTGRETGRIDVCTANEAASLDTTVNGPLHLVVPHDLRS